MNVQHVFLDNNIIYDYTEQRRPFYFEALQLIDLAIKNQYKMYLSVGAIINAYYIYRKLPLELVDKQFRFFVDRFTMVPFTADSIQEGVYSEWKDREDAFVHFSIRKHFARNILSGHTQCKRFYAQSLTSCFSYRNAHHT